MTDGKAFGKNGKVLNEGTDYCITTGPDLLKFMTFVLIMRFSVLPRTTVNERVD